MNRNIIKFAFLIGFLCVVSITVFSSNLVYSDDYYVNPDPRIGSDERDTPFRGTTIEEPWQSIRYALSELASIHSGDPEPIVHLVANTYGYAEDFHLGPIEIHRNVTIVGEGSSGKSKIRINTRDIEERAFLSMTTSSITLKNLIIENATVGFDSAVNRRHAIILEDCEIRHNNIGVRATNSALLIKNTLFKQNNEQAIHLKRGACITDMNIDIENCTFQENNGNFGGAIYAWEDLRADSSMGKLNLNINKCTFIQNSAIRGSAIFAEAVSNAIISNSQFANNTSTRGACLYFSGFNNPTPDYDYNPRRSDVYVINCTIDSNLTTDSVSDKGTIFLYPADGGDLHLYTINNIFTNNYDENEDRKNYAIYNSDNIKCIIEALDNCNFYNNEGIYKDTDNDILSISDLTLDFAHNNIGENPLYDELNSDYPYNLLEGSPCIERGRNDFDFDNDGNPDFELNEDLAENTRPVDSDNDGLADYDIGAYEYQLSNVAEPPVITITDPITENNSAEVAESSMTLAGYVNIPCYVTVGNETQTANEDNEDGDYQFSFNVILEEGTNTISIEAVDTEDSTNRSTLTLTITYNPPVTEPPFITITVPIFTTEDTDFNADVSPMLLVGYVDIPCRVTVGGETQETDNDFSFNVNLIPNEPNIVTVGAVDLGNDANRNTLTLIVTYNPVPEDTEAPIINIHQPEDITNGKTSTNQPEITIAGKVEDESDLEKVVITLNGEEIYNHPNKIFSIDNVRLNQTEHNDVVVTATDIAGNSSMVEFDIIYDDTPPTINLKKPIETSVDAEWHVSSDYIELSGTVTEWCEEILVQVAHSNGAGEYRFSGSSFYLERINLSEGVNTIRIIATDWVGGNSNSLTLTVTYTPPEPIRVEITNPLHGDRFNADNALIQVDGIIHGYVLDLEFYVYLNGDRLYLDTPLTAQDDGSFSISVDLLEPGDDGEVGVEGNNTIKVETKGESDSVTVILDTVVPVITITPPINSIVNEPSIEISGTLEEDCSEVKVDGEQLDKFHFDGRSFNTSIDLIAYEETIILIEATDLAGNTNSKVIKVTYIPEEKYVNITAPSDGDRVNIESIMLEGTVNGIKHPCWIYVSLNETPVEDLQHIRIEENGQNGNFSINNFNIKWGENKIEVIAKDSYGNIITPDSVTVTLDQEAPNITDITPKNGTRTSESSTKITGYVNESCTLYIKHTKTIERDTIVVNDSIRVEIDEDSDVPVSFVSNKDFVLGKERNIFEIYAKDDATNISETIIVNVEYRPSRTKSKLNSLLNKASKVKSKSKNRRQYKPKPVSTSSTTRSKLTNLFSNYKSYKKNRSKRTRTYRRYR